MRVRPPHTTPSGDESAIRTHKPEFQILLLLLTTVWQNWDQNWNQTKTTIQLGKPFHYFYRWLSNRSITLPFNYLQWPYSPLHLQTLSTTISIFGKPFWKNTVMAGDQLTARSAYGPPPADYTANMTLDWATNIDESIGPVPSASDFHPTKPQSHLPSPNLAPCSPDNSVTPAKPVRIITAPTSLQNVFVFTKHDQKSTKTTAAPITGKMAPHASDVRSPVLHIQPSMNRHPEGLNEPPSLLPSLQPTPLSSNSATPQPDCALPKPAVTHKPTCADDADDAGEYTPHPPLHFSTPAPNPHLHKLLHSN